MSLQLHSFEYLGLKAGSWDPDLPEEDRPPFFIRSRSDDEGISGLDLPQFRTQLTSGQRNGAVPGSQYSDPMVPMARVVTRDITAFRGMRQAMKPRPSPLDEVPWTFTGFGFPGTHILYVRPEHCEFVVTRLGTTLDWWAMDLAWTSSDGLVYSEEPETFVYAATGAPSAEAEVTVTNPGLDGARMGRAVQFRATAHGTVTSPRLTVIRDGVEQVLRFPGLTMTGGQVLTIGDDLQPRVGSQIVSGYLRQGDGSRAPRYPVLAPGDSLVRVECATGLLSGFVKVRGVW